MLLPMQRLTAPAVVLHDLVECLLGFASIFCGPPFLYHYIASLQTDDFRKRSRQPHHADGHRSVSIPPTPLEKALKCYVRSSIPKKRLGLQSSSRNQKLIPPMKLIANHDRRKDTCLRWKASWSIQTSLLIELQTRFSAYCHASYQPSNISSS